MLKEIMEYEKYLLNFDMVKKPKMPKFDIAAYTENEYVNAIKNVVSDFENIEDEHLTIHYLKGD